MGHACICLLDRLIVDRKLRTISFGLDGNAPLTNFNKEVYALIAASSDSLRLGTESVKNLD